MERLATRYHNGRIWVAPLARFLAYQHMIENLRVETERVDKGVRFVLSGARAELRPSDYQGLTLGVTGSEQLVEIVCVGRDGVRTVLSHEVCSKSMFGPEGEKTFFVETFSEPESKGRGMQVVTIPLDEFPRFPF
jgi:hypothetical protein